MASEILKRDENRVTVVAGVTNDADQEVSMLRVDPVTKYLLVVASSAAASSANTTTIARRDQNNAPVCMAYDEENDQLVEVLTDANGYILCDITE